MAFAGLVVGSAGCGRVDTASSSAPVVVTERSALAPARPEKRMRKLVPDKNAHPAPETTVALAPDTVVDARVLVVTTDGTDSAFDAITSALGLMGTPYDVLNATTGPTLTDAALADGTHGKYQAVFLDLGDLTAGGTSAFTADEWMTLASYEARFGVRRVALYTSPSADYGLQLAAEIDPETNPFATHCTAAGAAVFVGANCAAPVTIDVGWAYAATATDAQTTPLLVDDAGRILAASRVYPDGREALALTFAQSPYALHTLELGYGLVNWATRGLFIGEHHVYLSAQLDDFFLASAIYGAPGATYRINAADLDALAAWQTLRRTNPLVASLRLAWAANAQGSGPSDPLTMKAVALGPTFSWISHTWDHTDLTLMSYPDALVEFTRNDQTLLALGLQPYATENLVTPGITGLDNPNAMLAAAAAGIKQLVSDTSIKGEGNPTPNGGFCNALVPSLLEMPRIPTNLFFDVSQPAEWETEYAVLLKTTATYEQILTTESRTLAGYLLAGNVDPWMFHQANARDNGGGHSLLSDLLDRTLDRYLAAATFPVLSPTMDELAKVVLARMAFNASGASATIANGSQLTVQVQNAAVVPVTGLCTKDAESYAGQIVSHLELGAGAAASFTLGDCSAMGSTGTNTPPTCPSVGPVGGTTGAGGAGGAAGNGDATGSAGAGGSSGATGSAGAGGSSGATGSAGAGGDAGTTGAAGAGGGGEVTGAGGGGPTGGSAEMAGQAGSDQPPPAPGGHGCSVAEPAPHPLALALSALGGLVLSVGRRRRRAR